jgi:hypothetical protein
MVGMDVITAGVTMVGMDSITAGIIIMVGMDIITAGITTTEIIIMEILI